MSQLMPFDFDEQPVRLVDRDGAPWFVLADVCRILDITNVGDAAARLDDDERDDIALSDTIGREQRTLIINESGLYRLVLRSRKEAARRFGKWVTAEVLPTIRRTGAYGMPAPPNLDDNTTLRALLLGRLDKIDALEPKALAFDRLSSAEGAMAVTHAAKAMGVKPGRLFDWLEEHRWLYRGSDGLVGYQAKIDCGLIEHKVERIDRGPLKPAKLVNRALLTAKGIAKLAELGAAR